MDAHSCTCKKYIVPPPWTYNLSPLFYIVIVSCDYIYIYIYIYLSIQGLLIVFLVVGVLAHPMHSTSRFDKTSLHEQACNSCRIRQDDMSPSGNIPFYGRKWEHRSDSEFTSFNLVIRSSKVKRPATFHVSPSVISLLNSRPMFQASIFLWIVRQQRIDLESTGNRPIFQLCSRAYIPALLERVRCSLLHYI